MELILRVWFLLYGTVTVGWSLKFLYMERIWWNWFLEFPLLVELVPGISWILEFPLYGTVMVGWFLEFPLYGTVSVGCFLEFPLYGTNMADLVPGISSIWNGYGGFDSWNFLYMERIW